MEDEKERLQAIDEFFAFYNRIRKVYGLKMHFRSDKKGVLIEITDTYQGHALGLVSRVTAETETMCYRNALVDLQRYESLHPAENKKIS